MRTHLVGLVAAIPTLPAELDRAASLIGAEIGARGVGWVVLVFAIFVGSGLAAQQVFWRVARVWREWVALALVDTIRERLQAVVAKLSFAVTHVLVFALGSLGAFLLFEWPHS